MGIVIMLSTVLILAFGFLGASASSLGSGCEGDEMPDGHVCESDGILHHYADPEDCHMFYDCYNGCLYHRTCPEHENWSKSMDIVIGTIMLIVVLTLDHQDQMISFALKHKECLKTPKIVPNTTVAVIFMQLVIFATQ